MSDTKTSTTNQPAAPGHHLEHHPGLLQKVRPHVGSDDVVVSVEPDLDVLPKTTAVVVPGSLRIPDGLGDRGQRQVAGDVRGRVHRVHGVRGRLTSMMGLDANTFSSTFASLAEPPTVAKKRMAYLAETVFPAPDSPLTMMDWFLSSLWGQRTDNG